MFSNSDDVLKIFTCDLCPKVIFDTSEALERHIATKHGASMEEISRFLNISKEDVLSAVDLENKENNSTQAIETKLEDRDWTSVGRRILALAAKRDAGAEKLDEARLARRQLETVVKDWNPSAEVFIFGSSVVMGCWDGNSDIDFAVVDPKAYLSGTWPPDERSAVRELTERLRRAALTRSSLECVDTARVPIVKHSGSRHVSDFKNVAARTVLVVARKKQAASVPAKEGGVGDEKPEGEATEAVPLVERIKTCLSPLSGAIEQIQIHPDNDSVVQVTCRTTSDVVHVGLSLPPREFEALSSSDVHVPELHTVDFDLCLRQFGIRNSELLRRYLHAHPCARPGSIALKEWSKLWGVNNSFMGFLTSYAVNILWIYFLVQRGLVPFVPPESILDDPSTALKEPEYRCLVPDLEALSQQMGHLLTDFFRYYAFEFDWDNNVVSLNREGTTTKEMLKWSTETELKLGRASRNVRYIMCIEDPYEPNLNLGRHLGLCKSRKVRAEFVRALSSLMKDKVEHCTVFGGREDPNAYVPVQDPPEEVVQELTDVATKLFDSRDSKIVTADLLRQTFQSSSPEAFKTASQQWKWRMLVRRLGYRQVIDRIEKRQRQFVRKTYPITRLQPVKVEPANPPAPYAVPEATMMTKAAFVQKPAMPHLPPAALPVLMSRIMRRRL